MNADNEAAAKLRAKIDASLAADKAKHDAENAAAAALRGKTHSKKDLHRPWGSPAEVWTAHMPEHIQDGGYAQLRSESMADALARIRH